MLQTGAIQIINLILILGGISAFVLFIVVLLKLNKALSVWLEKNPRD